MIIANKYKIIEKLAEGCFGCIFKGENIRTSEKIAIKLESISSELKLLKNEAKIYQYLGNIDGFPSVKWFGIINGYYYMVLPLLGDSLETLHHTNTYFSLTRIFSISSDIIKRLKYIHQKGLIHRDIKPNNFLLGLNNELTVHMIDFGFCRKYLKTDNKTHIEFKTNRSIIGTPNFVSVNVHNGYEPSRRDDLESVAYMMIYFQLGQLEWNQPHCSLEKMRELKINIHNNIFVNSNILQFLNYCRNLRFDETPDYDIIAHFLK